MNFRLGVYNKIKQIGGMWLKGTAIEITEEMIDQVAKNFVDIANEKYNNASIKFKTSGLNIVDKKFDIAIASGVAGNRGGPACTPSELNKFLKYMLDSANLTMINFPSIYATIRSDNVEYFSPEYLLSSSLRFTDNVEIIHKHKFDVLLIMRR